MSEYISLALPPFSVNYFYYRFLARKTHRAIRKDSRSMFARLTQLSRHLSRPLPNYAHSAAAASRAVLGTNIMVSPEEKSKRNIHTAGCIIIGDEVLGGKVCFRYQLIVLHPLS